MRKQAIHVSARSLSVALALAGSGAVSAAAHAEEAGARADGAEIIIGPLFAPSVQAVGQAARAAGNAAREPLNRMSRPSASPAISLVGMP